jgi:hypothetical protein
LQHYFAGVSHAISVPLSACKKKSETKATGIALRNWSHHARCPHLRALRILSSVASLTLPAVGAQPVDVNSTDPWLSAVGGGLY